MEVTRMWLGPRHIGFGLATPRLLTSQPRCVARGSYLLLSSSSSSVCTIEVVPGEEAGGDLDAHEHDPDHVQDHVQLQPARAQTVDTSRHMSGCQRWEAMLPCCSAGLCVVCCSHVDLQVEVVDVGHDDGHGQRRGPHQRRQLLRLVALRHCEDKGTASRQAARIASSVGSRHMGWSGATRARRPHPRPEGGRRVWVQQAWQPGQRQHRLHPPRNSLHASMMARRKSMVTSQPSASGG